MYQSTSGAAFGDMQGIIARKQSEVLRLFRAAGRESAGYNNRQVAQILGWPINTVTPRVLELREAGKLELAERRPDNLTGRTVMHWRVSA